MESVALFIVSQCWIWQQTPCITRPHNQERVWQDWRWHLEQARLGVLQAVPLINNHDAPLQPPQFRDLGHCHLIRHHQRMHLHALLQMPRHFFSWLQ